MAPLFASSGGIVPVSWLEYNHICFIAERFPRVEGIVPVTELKVIDQDSKVDKSPI